MGSEFTDLCGSMPPAPVTKRRPVGRLTGNTWLAAPVARRGGVSQAEQTATPRRLLYLASLIVGDSLLQWLHKP